MSAETVGRHMPASVTLDDLTAMMVTDEHHHRYEISPEAYGMAHRSREHQQTVSPKLSAFA